jgi:ribosomal-protein-alanine N-acetyltransferase
LAAQLRTERLVLRRWRAEDDEPFAALNSDPEVMRFFLSPLTRSESDALAERADAALARDGFGLWAVEVVATGAFIGFTGLSVPGFEAHFTPAVEVGWRLARPAWGHGYATEAATAALDHGFGAHGLEAVVSFTAEGNLRSRAVMERLGMEHDPSDDFVHPRLPSEHPLAPHVLYRLGYATWQSRRAGTCG